MKYAALILLFVAFGCSKNSGNNGGEFVGPVHNATLKISVLQATSPTTYNGVQNADVSLHASIDDASDSTNPLSSQNTGTTGQVTFNNLDLEKHFVRTSHPAFGVAIDSLNTPARSTTTMEVWL